MTKGYLAVLLCLAIVLTVSCAHQRTIDSDPEWTLAKNIAEGLIAASPVADPADAKARERSAEKLSQFSLLRDSARDLIYWGDHTPDHTYRPEDNNLTAFNSFVWRKMYLPLFMFTGDYQIERTATGLTLLSLDCRFRYALDAGAYPYPFWHSQKKWVSYELSTKLILVFEKGRIIAAYRSETQDPTRPRVARQWDGRFRWADGDGREMPYVALFNYLFSPANPYVGDLDAAYRTLEAEARQYNCTFCHSPSNPVQMNPLRLLNLPNQALSVRHHIVTQLEEHKMPPEGHNLDPAQRQKLIDLARSFATLGDRALNYEGELSRQQPGEEK
jgi:hypothetical protein